MGGVFLRGATHKTSSCKLWTTYDAVACECSPHALSLSGSAQAYETYTYTCTRPTHTRTHTHTYTHRHTNTNTHTHTHTNTHTHTPHSLTHTHTFAWKKHSQPTAQQEARNVHLATCCHCSMLRRALARAQSAQRIRPNACRRSGSPTMEKLTPPLTLRRRLASALAARG